MKTFNHVNSKSIHNEQLDYAVISKMFIPLEKSSKVLICPKFFKDVMGDFKIETK